jgi:hypothetical protein
MDARFYQLRAAQVPHLSLLGTFQFRKAKSSGLAHWEATKIDTLRLIAAMFILARLPGLECNIIRAIWVIRGQT